MRLQDRPRFRANLGAEFERFEDAVTACRAVAQAGLYPSNLRLLDPNEALYNGAGDGSRTLLLVAFESAMPDRDAPHIAQLKAAGAIPIARTNLPDFGFRWHTDNALRGPTKNPWDASRSPGGRRRSSASPLPRRCGTVADRTPGRRRGCALS